MAAKSMPTHNGPPQKTNATTGAPNQALYIANLPDKIQKQDLRLSLYTLFSTYGPVLDVVALKTSKMRGQAHIVYRDIQASTQAMRALQGFDFFGKEMKIQYAKGRSNVFTKLEGVYRPPTVAAPALGATELQQFIFNAPPSSVPAAAPAAAPAATGGSAVVPKAAENTTNGVKAESEVPQGTKRRRTDESDEDAPMEEDDDDDVSMEASSEEE
ncbi:U2 snRNP complex subunit msl1 [Xylographa opegraphella]|nr:U2 snRNP complex subunit msl1 [Xylographa opegraphella]